MATIPNFKSVPLKPFAPTATPATWLETAEHSVLKPLDALNWTTSEGIPVKPLYTADDRAGLEHLDSFPGFAPFVRGPYASMYVSRP